MFARFDVVDRVSDNLCNRIEFDLKAIIYHNTTWKAKSDISPGGAVNCYRGYFGMGQWLHETQIEVFEVREVRTV